MQQHDAAAGLAADARSAEDRLDWEAAMTSWAAHAALSPQMICGHLGLARALIMLRRFCAAEGVLNKARTAFPSDTGLAILSATVATSTASWRHALHRWQAVLHQLPAHPSAAAQVALCARKLADEEARDTRLTALFDDFLSLGSNCEFGFVQKTHGSERPSLLRWGYTSYPSLLHALHEGFEGIGTPEQTEITVINSQYRIRDSRYGLGQHTFVYESEAAQDDVFRRQCQRLRLLSAHLLDALKNGRRICVYQSPDLTSSQARQLHGALQNYGRNTLLCVTPAPTGFDPGTFEFLEDGLMFAYNSHSGLLPDSTWDICTSQWIGFCKTAAQAGRAASVGSTRECSTVS